MLNVKFHINWKSSIIYGYLTINYKEKSVMELPRIKPIMMPLCIQNPFSMYKGMAIVVPNKKDVVLRKQ